MTIHRIALSTPPQEGAILTPDAAQSHYLTQVLRLREGAGLRVFHPDEGEFDAVIHASHKRSVEIKIGAQIRPPHRSPDLIVCFAPVKGGRSDTIIEKATELGARILQPVLTQRSVVDRVNPERLAAIARESAEQCERLDIPEIRPLLPLPQLLADWPAARLLLYGDESGESMPLTRFIWPKNMAQTACIVGPEGGFTTEEFAQLRHVRTAHGVGLGPRILRSDTAIITLCALIMQQAGDWDERPRYRFEE